MSTSVKSKCIGPIWAEKLKAEKWYYHGTEAYYGPLGGIERVLLS